VGRSTHFDVVQPWTTPARRGAVVRLRVERRRPSRPRRLTRWSTAWTSPECRQACRCRCPNLDPERKPDRWPWLLGPRGPWAERARHAGL